MADRLRQALDRAGIPGLERPRVWAVVFPADGGRPVLQTGPGFDGQFRVFFQNLFQEIGAEARAGRSALGSDLWTGRLHSTFGDAAGADLFLPDHQGRAFHVIFQQRCGLAAWDLLTEGGRPVAGYLVVQPVDRNTWLHGLRLALAAWARRFPDTALRPAFVPLAWGRGNPGILAHSDLATGDGADLVRRLGKGLGYRLAPRGEMVGQARLPVAALRDIQVGGSFWGMAFSLPPLTGHLAVLAGPAPPPVPTLLERLELLLRGGLLVFWGLYLPTLWFRGRPPDLGVRTQLWLVFLGLAATPLALTVGAEYRLAADLEQSWRAGREAELKAHLRRLETGNAVQENGFLQLVRAQAGHPGIGPTLLAAVHDPAVGNALLERIWSTCASAGMDLLAVHAVGPQDFSLGRFPDDMPEIARQQVGYLHRVFAGEFLASVTLDVRPVTGGQKATALGAMARLGLFHRNRGTLGPPDGIFRFHSGRRFTNRYHRPIQVKGSTLFYLFILWNQETSFASHLQRAVPSVAAGSPGAAFAALYDNGQGARLLVQAGEPGAMSGLLDRLRNRPAPGTASRYLTVVQPVRGFPAYTLVGSLPLADLYEGLARERRRTLLTLGGILLALLLAGAALSHGIAAPVARMTAGLRAVSAHDLAVRVAEDRDDELGLASRHLDRMIAWLRERDVMSRFVAPQVLEVVAAGDLEEACRPARREVMLLVSDIRGFTTLSESHPPVAVFILINRHLQAMTAVIQEQGGVIDRFIGDAIQAVFYPRGEDPAGAALKAARGMMAAHARLNAERRERGEFPYEIGIGLEWGEVVTGVLGARQVRLDFTVLGEPFKRAADLEAASKAGRASRIVASGKVASLAGPAWSFLPLPHPDTPDAWELDDPGGAQGPGGPGRAAGPTGPIGGNGRIAPGPVSPHHLGDGGPSRAGDPDRSSGSGPSAAASGSPEGPSRWAHPAFRPAIRGGRREGLPTSCRSGPGQAPSPGNGLRGNPAGRRPGTGCRPRRDRRCGTVRKPWPARHG